jgi:hypothetical protein
LVEYSSKNKIPIQIDEGYTIDTQRLSRKTSQEQAVTCLRDPIERIKSSYRFESRWEQHDKNVSIDTMKPFSIWAGKIAAITITILFGCTLKTITLRR